MCPGNYLSAGKQLHGTARKGSPWLRQLLLEAAHAAARTNTYLCAQYRRLATRRGTKKALFAVAHSILVIIYHLLARQVSYHDLGANFFDEQDREMLQKRLVRRLEHLGYQVALQTTPPAA
jgi:transposase